MAFSPEVVPTAVRFGLTLATPTQCLFPPVFCGAMAPRVVVPPLEELSPVTHLDLAVVIPQMVNICSFILE